MMDDIREGLAKKVADDTDEFYFRVLAPYGITRETFVSIRIGYL